MHEFLKDWIPDEPRQKPTAARWCNLLKDKGSKFILDKLQGIDLSKTSAAVQESHRLLTGYCTPI